MNTLNYYLSKFKKKRYDRELKIDQIREVFPDRNSQYHYFHNYFWHLAPVLLRAHRKYFSRDKRGFGEDAFHAMWYFLFREFRPKNVLEIGIYRGQTISLFSLLDKYFGIETNIHGISPFTSAGDNVSKYLVELDYYKDVILNFKHFDLPLPTLHKGFSTDTSMLQIIQSLQWDMVYIDGNHDYEVAQSDFDICSRNLKKGGLIILDDASLYTEFSPASFSTAGHPGPSKVASRIDSQLFEEILSVGHNRVFKKIK